MGKLNTLAAALGILAAASGLAIADDGAPWKVQNRLLGKPGGAEIAKAEDVSGIACDRDGGFPRVCLVVDDESQGAQVVVLQDGLLIAGDPIPLIDDTFGGAPLELDAEGVAYADGAFYVTGSHGRPRHEPDAGKEEKSNAKAAATRKLFRITLAQDSVDLASGKLIAQPKIEMSRALALALGRDPLLEPFADIALADKGVTIEGIAVRDGALFAGLRSPVLDGRDAVILEMPLSTLFSDARGGPSKLHRLALGRDTRGRPRGIRDLATTADGFLLIAGPAQEPPKGTVTVAGDYTLLAWDGAATTKIADFPLLGKKLKPEALLPLELKDKKLRVLVLFDGGKEGAPRAVTLDLP